MTRTRKPRYTVEGPAVLSRDGGVVYDFLDDPVEAKTIADVLNEGKGPGWDEIRDEVYRRVKAAKAAKAKKGRR